MTAPYSTAQIPTALITLLMFCEHKLVGHWKWTYKNIKHGTEYANLYKLYRFWGNFVLIICVSLSKSISDAAGVSQKPELWTKALHKTGAKTWQGKYLIVTPSCHETSIFHIDTVTLRVVRHSFPSLLRSYRHLYCLIKWIFISWQARAGNTTIILPSIPV